MEYRKSELEAPAYSSVLCLRGRVDTTYRVHIAHVASVYKASRLYESNLSHFLDRVRSDRVENIRELLVLT